MSMTTEYPQKGAAQPGDWLVSDVSLPALTSQPPGCAARPWTTTSSGCRRSSAAAARSWRPTARPA
jgi:hypothetical protein